MAGMSDHPVVVFKTEERNGVSDISGIDILSLNTHQRYPGMSVRFCAFSRTNLTRI